MEELESKLYKKPILVMPTLITPKQRKTIRRTVHAATSTITRKGQAWARRSGRKGKLLRP